MKPLIAVLGANPSWQKTLFFDRLRAGKVNRAARMEEYAAGKGLNFCRACRIYGQADTRLFQFAGGENGRKIRDALDSGGVSNRTVCSGATRCCITCLDADGGMTEIIEPSKNASPDEIAALLGALRSETGSFAMLSINGSLPGSTPVSLYTDAANAAFRAGIPVLLDTAYPEVLGISRSGYPVYLKINRGEFASVCGETDTLPAVRRVVSEHPGLVLAVTDGPGTALMAAEGRLFSYGIPCPGEIVSPLGCGDITAAVFASSLVNGIDAAESFRRGLAAATAGCLCGRAGDFSLEQYNRILNSVTVESSVL